MVEQQVSRVVVQKDAIMYLWVNKNNNYW